MLVGLPGQAEVGNLDRMGSRKQQIARFEIAVDDPSFMDGPESECDLPAPFASLGKGLSTLIVDEIFNITAVHQFEHRVQDRLIAGFRFRHSSIEYPHDMRVVQPRENPSLIEKPLGGVRAVIAFEHQYFHSDFAIEKRVDCCEDRADGAAAQTVENAVISEQQSVCLTRDETRFLIRREKPEMDEGVSRVFAGRELGNTLANPSQKLFDFSAVQQADLDRLAE